MKKVFLFIGLLLTFNNLTAQKKVVEKISSSNIEDVFVHVKFANDIVVKNWDRNEISVEAEVNINDNEENDYFSFKTDKIGSTFTVKSDYGTFFKEHRNTNRNSEGKVIHGDCNSVKYCTCHNKVLVNYVIYVPRKMELKVKSISGDVAATEYEGVLNLDLISGNITVKKHSKEMNLKTISGDIDVFISDATFEAKTLTGGIYSDLDIDFEKARKREYGSRIVGTIKKGNASLRLNTISGDIFLRKI